MQTDSTPVAWLHKIIEELRWPTAVFLAFKLGRYVKGLEHRMMTAEKSVKDLMERHLPHIHKALGLVNGKLETIQALLTKGK